MIINLEVNPDNPIYKGCRIQKVIKEGEVKYCLKLKMTQESVEIIRSNFYRYYLGLAKDGRPILVTGSAPVWIQVLVVLSIKQIELSPDIEFKKGKDKVKLTE